MLKGISKITALLIATTSIISIVPTMASERLGNKEDTLKQAIAFQNGYYSYYGYRTDDDNTGI